MPQGKITAKQQEILCLLYTSTGYHMPEERMGEHPPNIRFSLHLVNLTGHSDSCSRTAKRCMALSFAIKLLFLLTPVSYTHLDVYKRQH